MASTTRSRILPFNATPSGVMENWTDTSHGRQGYTKSVIQNSKAFDQLAGTQVTASETHTGWRSRDRKRFYGDIGSDFSSYRQHVTSGDIPISCDFTCSESLGYPTYDVNVCTYHGPILPVSPAFMTFPSVIHSSDSHLAVLGTEAIARCSPSNPTANLTTFLGELLGEGLPHLVGKSLKEMRSIHPKELRKGLSKEYLNYQFGWLPFISDLRQLSHSLLNAHKIINQYSRGSGSMVRRRYAFPTTTSTSISVIRTNAIPWFLMSSSVMDKGPPYSGQVFCETKTTVDQWFSGAFTYYIPPDHTVIGEIDRKVIFAKKLLGASLTPDSVWNLAPWSWLVDWFLDAGDLLKNLDNWIIDNQVLLYGYMMEHSTSSNTYTFVGDPRLRASVPIPSLTFTSEWKLRRKATPYGFGLTWDSLSHFQQSILVALGLSKWRR